MNSLLACWSDQLGSIVSAPPTAVKDARGYGRIPEERDADFSRYGPTVCTDPSASRGPAGRSYGDRYDGADSRPEVLRRLVSGKAWALRSTLLSPFDNLIINRSRTEELFDFRFRMHIYVPKTQRQFGYFVMPMHA